MIEKRKKRIAYIYDSACNYIDNYWKGKNILNNIRDVNIKMDAVEDAYINQIKDVPPLI